MVTALLVIQVCVKSHFIQKRCRSTTTKKKLGIFTTLTPFFQDLESESTLLKIGQPMVLRKSPKKETLRISRNFAFFNAFFKIIFLAFNLEMGVVDL